MRHLRATKPGDRSNALWGRGSRGESRSNALWGRGGRRAGVATAMVVGRSHGLGGRRGASRQRQRRTGSTAISRPTSPDTLLSAIQQNPTQSFDVILQGDRKARRSRVHPEDPCGPERLERRDRSEREREAGVHVDRRRSADADRQADPADREERHRAVDRPERDGEGCRVYSNLATQLWPSAIDVWSNWQLGLRRMRRRSRSSTRASRSTAPTSARACSASVDLTSIAARTRSGDGFGHGTFVAGIAAGSASGYAGAMPNANLVSLDVMNDQGMGTVSDVIRGLRLDPREQGDLQHPGCELLAPLGEQGERHVRPARPGGREVVAERRRRRGCGRELRHGLDAERRPVRAGQRPVRDHGRRDRHRQRERQRRRLRRAVVGVRLHARRLREAGPRRSRPLPDRAGPGEPASCR